MYTNDNVEEVLLLRALILEDDGLIRINLRQIFTEHGFETQEAATLAQFKQMDLSKPNIAVVDLDLENDLDGLQAILPLVKHGCYVIVMTGREESQYIEQAYSKGCEDYLTKPISSSDLAMVIKKYRVRQNFSLMNNELLKKIVTQDDQVLNELKKVEELVLSQRPLIITGETGTGKTETARAIHSIVRSKESPFVHLNCSEVPENLIESEMFGVEKGAYTGATSDRQGKMAMANTGTLFLDEIATMPLSTQQKLLKAIELKRFYPLGGTNEMISDFFLITATCEDLEEKIKEGTFRQDLYYRIKGFQMKLPPLRDRRNDIPFLIKHFLKSGPRRVIIEPEALSVLENYSWPGNIRELKNVTELLKSKSGGIIKVQDVRRMLEFDITTHCINKDSAPQSTNKELLQLAKQIGLKNLTEKLERDILNDCLHENNGNVRQTMQELNISSSTYYKIKHRDRDQDQNSEDD